MRETPRHADPDRSTTAMTIVQLAMRAGIDAEIALIDEGFSLDEYDCLKENGFLARAERAEKALELHVEYERIPTDRGGKNGRKGQAWDRFVKARDAALASKESE